MAPSREMTTTATVRATTERRVLDMIHPRPATLHPTISEGLLAVITTMPVTFTIAALPGYVQPGSPVAEGTKRERNTD